MPDSASLVNDRMTYAALYEAERPREFDQIVNADPEMQRTLLRWRSHLALAARAYHQMVVNAYGDGADKGKSDDGAASFEALPAWRGASVEARRPCGLEALRRKWNYRFDGCARCANRC
jgi:hypothetical protein